MFKKSLLVILLALSITAIHAQTVTYVTNANDNTVSVIDTSTNAVTATIAVGSVPEGVAISPDGTRVYVANLFDGTISVIDTASNTVIATIPAGSNPAFLAVTPDGKSLYVPEPFNGNVLVLSTATNTVTASIAVPILGDAVALTPDGARAYVRSRESVSVIDTATNTVVQSIAVNTTPPPQLALGIAVTPGGGDVYVAGGGDSGVSVIATANNSVVANIPSPQPTVTTAVAVTPDGGRVYVADEIGHAVDVIDTATNTLEPSPIPVGTNPFALAVTPDGAFVYVVNTSDSTVSVISTATNTVVGTPIPVGGGPIGIAIANLSAPFAAFTIDNLVINNNLHEQGDFTLGANTGGIDLAHQPLTLTVNNFSLTIPVGSFKQVGGNMHFVFNGTVNGLSVSFNISADHGSSTQFSYTVDVHGVSVTGPNPATVSLKIGHNSGTTTSSF